MKKVTKEFREKIKTDLGYDDTHIEILQRDLERSHLEIKETEPRKKPTRTKSKADSRRIKKIAERIRN